MAGGFSIQKSRIKDFKEYIKDKFNIKEFQTIKLYDCELTFSSIHKELFFDLEKLSPFGPGNPKPKFLIKNCFIRFPRLVGNNHFSCFVEDSTGNRLKGIFFGAYDAGVGQKLERYNGEIDLIVTIKLNNWNGEENLEIQIEDVINF